MCSPVKFALPCSQPRALLQRFQDALDQFLFLRGVFARVHSQAWYQQRVGIPKLLLVKLPEKKLAKVV
jgi:hypothetical protein